MAKMATDLRSLARSHTHTAIKTLAHVMREPTAPPSARVAAASELLDRGWGKAEQVSKNELDVNVRYVLESVPDEQWATEFSPKRITNGNANGGAH
jgi:hypothetical protein